MRRRSRRRGGNGKSPTEPQSGENSQKPVIGLSSPPPGAQAGFSECLSALRTSLFAGFVTAQEGVQRISVDGGAYISLGDF